MMTASSDLPYSIFLSDIMVIREEIEIEGISIMLERKNIKNLYLRIKPDGTVRVSSPMRLSDDAINDFILSRIDWIKDTQSKMLENPPKPKVKYQDGETHYIWGEPYTLHLISNENAKKAFYDIDENIIYLPVAKRSNINQREKILFELYRAEMNRNLSCFLDKCTGIVGHEPKEVKIRNMKNWGNCRKDKRITLNLKLAKKPPICTEYVLIHELCHLIEFNHSPRFKALMDHFCPNWREIKRLLNEE